MLVSGVWCQAWAVSASKTSLIWLPTGIASGFLFRWGLKHWPGVFLGVFLLQMNAGVPLLLSVAIACTGTIGTGLCAWILRRYDLHPTFGFRPDVVVFILASAVGMLITASGGVLGLWIAQIIPTDAVRLTWATWWRGDFAGVVVAAPLLISSSRKSVDDLQRRRPELLAFAGAFVVLSWFVSFYSGRFGEPIVTVILIIWSAMRFGVLGSSLTVLISSLIAAWGVGSGRISFDSETQLSFSLWFYMLTWSFISLMITAIKSAEDRVQELLAAKTERINLLTGDVDNAKTLQLEMIKWMEQGEREVRFMCDQLPQIVWWGTANGPEYFNKRLTEYTGRSIPDLMDDLATVVHPDDRAATSQAFREGFAHGKTIQLEQRIRAADGSYQWFLVRATPLRGEDGQIIRWYGTTTNIDELKRESEAKIAREHAYRMALEAGQMLKWEIDLQTGTVGISGDIAKIVGRDMPEQGSSGFAAARLIPDADRHRFFAALRESLRSAKSQELQLRVQRPDGEFAEISIWWSVLYDLECKPTRVLGLLRDISERRHLERQMEASEARFRHIFETALEGIWLIDGLGNTISVNESLTRILGYTKEEMVGKSFVRFVDQVDVDRSLGYFESCLANKGEPNDFRIIHKSGRDVWVIASGIPIYDESNSLLGVCVFLVDISDRKKTAIELVEAKRAAEHANAVKTQFLANMSHELRTPVAAILGFAEMLTQVKEGAPERDYAMEGIGRNCEHLLSLIGNILDISKIESGRVDIFPLEYNPAKVVEEVYLSTIGFAETRRVNLSFGVVGDLPQSCLIDPTRLRQILVNLVNNGIKFSDVGKRVSIEARTESDGRELVFEVADQGIGISPANQKKLFMPFSQVDESMTRKYGGTGLGLSLSARLVEAMKGSIHVESSEGNGSRFTVRIPIVDPVKHAAIAGNIVIGGEEPKPDTKGKRAKLLLVEDSPEIRRIIAFYVEKAGYEIDFAENGQVGVEIGSRGQHDLILMDIQMPVLDGYQATRQLREAGITVPIIALTAHASITDRDRSLEAGCNDYLTKPVSKTVLLDSIRNYTANSHALA